MTAKEYLRQIKLLDEKIKHRMQEQEEIRQMAMSTGALTYDADKVQTSLSGDSRQLRLIEKAADMDAEIQRMVDDLIDLKHRIIGEIHQLDDERYIRILFDRYVEGVPLRTIAANIGYEYKWLCRLHGYALSEFASLLLKTTRPNTI